MKKAALIYHLTITNKTVGSMETACSFSSLMHSRIGSIGGSFGLKKKCESKYRHVFFLFPFPRFALTRLAQNCSLQVQRDLIRMFWFAHKRAGGDGKTIALCLLPSPRGGRKISMLFWWYLAQREKFNGSLNAGITRELWEHTDPLSYSSHELWKLTSSVCRQRKFTFLVNTRGILPRVGGEL